MQTTGTPSYFLGLDLGQMQDYTALAVVERVQPARRLPRGPLPATVYHLRHVERPDLGTPYTEIAGRVAGVQRTPPLTDANTTVVGDFTGVGVAVFEMLEASGVVNLHGVSIHGGEAVSQQGRIHRVPKRELVSTLQVLLQQRRLRFATGMPLADVLRRELRSFKAKINLATGHDTYEAWREGDHDDVVLALAMACWFAERGFGAGRQRNYAFEDEH
jgi:hypothetical protein